MTRGPAFLLSWMKGRTGRASLLHSVTVQALSGGRATVDWAGRQVDVPYIGGPTVGEEAWMLRTGRTALVLGPSCQPIVGEASGGTLTVPAGVTTAHVLVAVMLVPYGGLTSEPSGLDAYSDDGYTLAGSAEWSVITYEPVVHDGRSSYEWDGSGVGSATIRYAFLPCVDFGSWEGVTFAYSYPGEQYPGSGRDPMEWGYLADGDYTGWLLAYVWSARDESGDEILFGVGAWPLEWTDEGSSVRVDNTLAWPGNNTVGTQYDWTTKGFVFERS